MKTTKLLLRAVLLGAALACVAAIPGSAPYYNAALSSTAVLVKAQPCYLSGYNIANTNASIVYVQVFDAVAAGNVTVGVTSPTIVLAVPGNGILDGPQVSDIPFQNGIVIAATTTATGSSAPGSALSATILTR